MLKNLNQLLISQNTIKKWRRIVLPLFLLYTLHFTLYTALHCASYDSIQLTVRPNFGPPTSVTDLNATMGATVDKINLMWTVPAEDPAPYLGELVLNWPYHLKYSTNSLTALNNDTTAWWNQASEYPQGWSEVGHGFGYTRVVDITIQPEYYSKVLFFAIRAEDSGHLFSPNFNVASCNNNIPPREPRNLRTSMSSDKNHLTITWDAVTKSTDGAIVTDLSHYALYRTTDIITGQVSSWTLPISVTSTTTYTGGDTYYYWLTCHDLRGNVSRLSARVDSSPDLNITFYDQSDLRTSISIPQYINGAMYKESNSFDDNVYFDVVRLTSEEIGKTFRSYTFVPKKALTEEVIHGLLFARASANVQISYSVSGGYVGAPSLSSLSETKANGNLALFWFNGVEWVKVGGTVDENKRTVAIKSKKGGKYQMRQSMRSGSFALNAVYPRIFSPNGDGWNDVVNFMYDGNDEGMSGKIFDINGAFVSDMLLGDSNSGTETNNGGSLKWNGKDADGKVVPSGIYIYQIEVDKKVFNGTVVVAK